MKGRNKPCNWTGIMNNHIFLFTLLSGGGGGHPRPVLEMHIDTYRYIPQCLKILYHKFMFPNKNETFIPLVVSWI